MGVKDKNIISIGILEYVWLVYIYSNKTIIIN